MKNTLKTIAIAFALLITQQVMPMSYVQAAGSKFSSFWNTYAPAKPDFSGLAAQAASYMPDMSAAKAAAGQKLSSAKVVAVEKLAQFRGQMPEVSTSSIRSAGSKALNTLQAKSAELYEAAKEATKPYAAIVANKAKAGYVLAEEAAGAIVDNTGVVLAHTKDVVQPYASKAVEKAQAGLVAAQGQWNSIPQEYRPLVIMGAATAALVAKSAYSSYANRVATIQAMAAKGTLKVQGNDLVYNVQKVETGYKLKSTTLNRKGEPVEIRRIYSLNSLLEYFTPVNA